MPNPIIGFLHSGNANKHRRQIAAFFRGLQSTDHTAVDVDVRPLWANDDPQALIANADTLVNLGLAALVAAGGSRSAVEAKNAVARGNTPAKRATPIVFTNVADPFGAGLVTDLEAPDKNITGTAALTAELDAKRLELLHELKPAWTEIGALVNGSRPNFADETAELAAAAARLGVNCRQVDARNLAQITTAFNTTFPNLHVTAVLITADALYNNNRDDIIRLASTASLPAIYQWREFAAAGGLMSYGPNINAGYIQAGVYAGNIVDGQQINTLPIVIPSTDDFELTINTRTAKALRQDVNVRLKIPGSLLARATLVRK